MTRRLPRKGRGAEIFLGEDDSPPVKKRRTPKGKGADVFLGAEPAPVKPRKPKLPPATPKPAGPPRVPDLLVTGLDELCRTLAPSYGRIDRSHLVVTLWLWLTLQEARR
jgi:hypothetical protein